MEASIVPDGAPVSARSISLHGVRVSNPRLETAGLWLMCDWKHDGDGDIFGVCVMDGDCEGFRAPCDEDAADALVNIMDSVRERFDVLLESEAADTPLPEILWDAWVFTRAAVEAHKMQPAGASRIAQRTGGRP